MVVRAADDYYDILGVSKSADKKEIKSAYRQKVLVRMAKVLGWGWA